MKRVILSTMLVAVLSFAGVMTAAYCEEQAQAQTREEMLREIRALRVRAEGLHMRVKSMSSIAEHLAKEAENWQLRADEADEADEDSSPIVQYTFVNTPYEHTTKPDFAALRALKLPENPTREEAEAYIRAVLHARAEWRSGAMSDDPEVRLLMRVGPENLFCLIKSSEKWTSGGDCIYAAVRELASEEHRQMIVGSLTRRPGLLPIIREKGWTIDARDALLELIEQEDGWYGRQALEALASLDDPDTYDAIIKHMEEKGADSRLGQLLQDNPDLNISRELAKAGLDLGTDSSYKMNSLQRAAEQGDVDALVALADTESNLMNLSELTGVWGTEAEVKAWIKENAEQLIYDADRRMYRHSFEGGDLRLQVLSVSDDDDYVDGFGRLSLPQNASADDVRQYIAQVLEISASNSPCSCCYSPRKIMLSLAGRDNLDILVEFLHTHPDDTDITAAMNRLVEPQDKYYIVGRLIDVPALTSVVLQQNWLKDARGQIIWALEAAEHPFGMYQLYHLLQQGDAEIRQAVLRYIQSTEAALPIWAVDLIPAPEREDIVLNVWDRIRTSGEEISLDTALAALRYGSITALEYALEHITVEEEGDFFYNSTFQRLLRHVDTEGELWEVREWYTANKGKLVYDPFYKIFEVRE